MSALTETERKIVSTYLQHRGKARDIAHTLGVSERTVYKALYKYRKLARERGIDPSAFYLRESASYRPSNIYSGSQSIAPILDGIKHEIIAELVPVIEEAVRQAIKRSLESTLFKQREEVLAAFSTPNHARGDSDQVARLISSIERLNENLVRFSQALTNIYSGNAVHAQQRSWAPRTHDDSLPSFVVDNPWLEVLSQRY